MYPPTNVGITNHVALHNLVLQNGHGYYATITGLSDKSCIFSLLDQLS